MRILIGILKYQKCITFKYLQWDLNLKDTKNFKLFL